MALLNLQDKENTFLFYNEICKASFKKARKKGFIVLNNRFTSVDSFEVLVGLMGISYLEIGKTCDQCDHDGACSKCVLQINSLLSFSHDLCQLQALRDGGHLTPRDEWRMRELFTAVCSVP